MPAAHNSIQHYTGGFSQYIQYKKTALINIIILKIETKLLFTDGMIVYLEKSRENPQKIYRLAIKTNYTSLLKQLNIQKQCMIEVQKCVDEEQISTISIASN